MTSESQRRPHRDQTYLPDFCTPAAALSVVLSAELVAIGMTLARQSGWDMFFADLAKTSLLILWMSLSSAAVLCALRRLLSGFPPPQATVWTLVTVQTVVLLVSEAVYWLGQLYGSELAPGWFPDDHGFFLSRNLVMGALITSLLLRYFYVTHQWQRNVERQAESRILALQARIRPHFLFNSMNTIADLTRSNPAAAESAVEDLADLFRASLRDGQEMVQLADELAITQVYERMEKQRLGKRLTVNWQVSELPDAARVPGLILQPLLENAIYHGIETLQAPGVVEVEGRRKGDMVYISVRNPLPPENHRANPGNRIAVENIRERLQLAFGQRAGLSTAIDSMHYQVNIAFPFRS